MTNEEIREQIQENIIAYIDSKAFLHAEQFKDDLCQIVVDCFGEDKKKNDPSRYHSHPEEVYNRQWTERHSKL
jgi:hypothetical protein